MANIKSNIPNFLSQPLKRNYIGAITRTITLDLNPSPQTDIPHHFFFFFWSAYSPIIIFVIFQ